VAITSYTELQTAVGNWLDRTDLASRIPEFIALAEPKMRRLLRDRMVRASLTMLVGFDSLVPPTWVKEVLALRYNTSNREYALRGVTTVALADLRRSGSGVPRFYTVVNGQILFDVSADAEYTLEVIYIENITPLSAGNPTNSTLTNSPDIYLYGALVEAEPYLEHDERVSLWETRFVQAISDENVFRERTELSGAPMEMRLPVVFGGEL
jgi:hypothetical protein